jgi:hypothetical protein
MNMHVLEALDEPTRSPVTTARGLMSKLSSSSKEANSHSFRQFGQVSSGDILHGLMI